MERMWESVCSSVSREERTVPPIRRMAWERKMRSGLRRINGGKIPVDGGKKEEGTVLGEKEVESVLGRHGNSRLDIR